MTFRYLKATLEEHFEGIEHFKPHDQLAADRILWMNQLISSNNQLDLMRFVLAFNFLERYGGVDRTCNAYNEYCAPSYIALGRFLRMVNGWNPLDETKKIGFHKSYNDEFNSHVKKAFDARWWLDPAFASFLTLASFENSRLEPIHIIRERWQHTIALAGSCMNVVHINAAMAITIMYRFQRLPSLEPALALYAHVLQEESQFHDAGTYEGMSESEIIMCKMWERVLGMAPDLNLTAACLGILADSEAYKCYDDWQNRLRAQAQRNTFLAQTMSQPQPIADPASLFCNVDIFSMPGSEAPRPGLPFGEIVRPSTGGCGELSFAKIVAASTEATRSLRASGVSLKTRISEGMRRMIPTLRETAASSNRGSSSRGRGRGSSSRGRGIGSSSRGRGITKGTPGLTRKTLEEHLGHFEKRRRKLTHETADPIPKRSSGLAHSKSKRSSGFAAHSFG